MIATLGEILLRLTPPDNGMIQQMGSYDANFGGSEANVAISLANYKIPTRFISALPDNELGKAAIFELSKYKVDTRHVNIKGNKMGIYFVEKGSSIRGSKVIYDREHSAFARMTLEDIDWDHVFDGINWFHWSGIAPAVSQNCADVTLQAVQRAAAADIPISADLNYRASLWTYGKPSSEVMPELLDHTTLMLGDPKSLEIMTGIKNPFSGDIKEQLDDLPAYYDTVFARFPKLKYIATSLRTIVNDTHHRWMGVIYDGQKLYCSTEYDLYPLVDRVGGGDAFMAGLIYGCVQYDDPQKTIDFATAASGIKHTISGDFNLVSVQDVNDLLARGGAGNISR
ncbi:sugar kinase [Reichenbachiella ulvae]|uniref:Sugar kinase n=1 Tax=Reichenbachiella ulvae TaxID=2980104 RepID=A0ABT3CTK2_9BACT|nr:sugar kinase [Reichenbachiella ulvae]MCV9386854.1 sugar kinase [Reichenbachiella ulvae]